MSSPRYVWWDKPVRNGGLGGEVAVRRPRQEALDFGFAFRADDRLTEALLHDLRAEHNTLPSTFATLRTEQQWVLEIAALVAEDVAIFVARRVQLEDVSLHFFFL